MGWGTAAVMTREGEGSFYRPGMTEGRRSDEVNAGGGGGVLMALQTSVSGWERRGQRPLQEGNRRRHHGVSVPMRWRWPGGRGSMKQTDDGGCCWLKEQDAQLGWCWATRPGGPKGGSGPAARVEKKEKEMGCQGRLDLEGNWAA
jgi:hypothetical protein